MVFDLKHLWSSCRDLSDLFQGCQVSLKVLEAETEGWKSSALVRPQLARGRTTQSRRDAEIDWNRNIQETCVTKPQILKCRIFSKTPVGENSNYGDFWRIWRILWNRGEKSRQTAAGHSFLTFLTWFSMVPRLVEIRRKFRDTIHTSNSDGAVSGEIFLFSLCHICPVLWRRPIRDTP